MCHHIKPVVNTLGSSAVPLCCCKSMAVCFFRILKRIHLPQTLVFTPGPEYPSAKEPNACWHSYSELCCFATDLFGRSIPWKPNKLFSKILCVLSIYCSVCRQLLWQPEGSCSKWAFRKECLCSFGLGGGGELFCLINEDTRASTEAAHAFSFLITSLWFNGP